MRKTLEIHLGASIDAANQAFDLFLSPTPPPKFLYPTRCLPRINNV